jgi:hypothetical protein
MHYGLYGGNMSIQIKDEDVLFGLMEKRHDPMLCRIIRWIAKEWGDIYITESYRKQRHANDLHGVIPVRATDLRSRIYVMPEMVEEKINENWQYDPDRPEMKVCVFHDVGEGPHFHIQTHPKTQRIA